MHTSRRGPYKDTPCNAVTKGNEGHIPMDGGLMAGAHANADGVDGGLTTPSLYSGWVARATYTALVNSNACSAAPLKTDVHHISSLNKA